MNKNSVLIGILIMVLICGAIISVVCIKNKNGFSNNETEKEVSKNENNIVNEKENESDKDNQQESEENQLSNSKSLVLYFSATNNTEKIAKYIQETTGSDIIEIKPKQEYTSNDLNYNNDNSRANKEQNDDNARPEILNIDLKLDDYQVIYLGYPIWWGKEPKIILTLLDNYNLEGKTIIPFCTSGSSGIETSVSNLRKYNSKLNVLDGKRFSSGESKEEVEKWIGKIQ